MNYRFYLFLSFFISIAYCSKAQLKLPNTDIYLVSLIKTDSSYALGDAQLISDWDGYDNQPYFAFDAQNIYYSTIRDLDRTDIYVYVLTSKQNLPFIETGSVSEFSPELTPDGRGLSLVRQDDLGQQQIWKYYFDGTDPLCITPQIKNIGYYCWIGDTELMIRRELNDTSSFLQWMNLKTKKIKDISKSPGISICKVPGEEAAYYIDKSHKTPRLMRYNVDTQASDSLTTVPEGVDNFTTTIENEVWIINNGGIYTWSPKHAAHWRRMASFNGGVLSNAYRLAVSRDMKWLALVVMPEKK